MSGAETAFEPTHTVPASGLGTFEAPDPSRPGAPLDPGLAVRVRDRKDDWAEIQCENGWTAWVDGRELKPLATAVDEGLFDALASSLEAVRGLVADLKAGRLDVDAFRARMIGAALVVREREAWILDLDNNTWWRYDGLGVSTVDLEDGRPT